MKISFSPLRLRRVFGLSVRPSQAVPAVDQGAVGLLPLLRGLRGADGLRARPAQRVQPRRGRARHQEERGRGGTGVNYKIHIQVDSNL